jgi:hypothetical protein
MQKLVLTGNRVFGILCPLFLIQQEDNPHYAAGRGEENNRLQVIVRQYNGGYLKAAP